LHFGSVGTVFFLWVGIAQQPERADVRHRVITDRQLKVAMSGSSLVMMRRSVSIW
jgi:hypothetical protein